MHMSEYERGREHSLKLDHGDSSGSLITVLREICPEFTRKNVQWFDTGIMARMVSPIETRVLILLASSASKGDRLPQVKSYAGAAIALGIAKEEIVEAVLQTLPVAGFPAVTDALFSVRDAIAISAR